MRPTELELNESVDNWRGDKYDTRFDVEAAGATFANGKTTVTITPIPGFKLSTRADLDDKVGVLLLPAVKFDASALAGLGPSDFSNFSVQDIVAALRTLHRAN
jgi:hypothetical protein